MKNLSKKETLLTQNRLKDVLNYNPETGDFIWVAKTSKTGVNRVGEIAGCLSNSNGYRQIKIDNHYYSSHRLVWLYVFGHFPKGSKCQIDHINGNRTDNRLVNLRVLSQAENCKNTTMKSNNTSGITGVRREGCANNSKTNPKTNWYWRAYWHNELGVQNKKSFSVEKFGEDRAKSLAINYRAEQVRLLGVEHGIVYTDRHGVKT